MENNVLSVSICEVETHADIANILEWDIFVKKFKTEKLIKISEPKTKYRLTITYQYHKPKKTTDLVLDFNSLSNDDIIKSIDEFLSTQPHTFEADKTLKKIKKTLSAKEQNW